MGCRSLAKTQFDYTHIFDAFSDKSFKGFEKSNINTVKSIIVWQT
jgi:hypothetical protein